MPGGDIKAGTRCPVCVSCPLLSSFAFPLTSPSPKQNIVAFHYKDSCLLTSFSDDDSPCVIHILKVWQKWFELKNKNPLLVILFPLRNYFKFSLFDLKNCLYLNLFLCFLSDLLLLFVVCLFFSSWLNHFPHLHFEPSCFSSLLHWLSSSLILFFTTFSLFSSSSKLNPSKSINA